VDIFRGFYPYTWWAQFAPAGGAYSIPHALLLEGERPPGRGVERARGGVEEMGRGREKVDTWEME